ncbi:hypothetical protein BH23CHL10_BH23CHL10_14830 [soil metagenome]
MSKNVAMFVDVANMYYAARGQDVDVDYVALLKHATKGRDLIRAYAYTGLDPENENQRKFIDFLGKNGYKPVIKDIRKFGDGRMKANLDIELVVDLFRLADRMDIAVIVSGDGDFAPAIKALQDKGVRCEVISFKPNTSSDLIAVADEFMDIMKVASISRKEGRAVRDSMSAPEMPAKEVSPEFGFRDASPSVAAAALAALRTGGATDGRRGRAAPVRRSAAKPAAAEPVVAAASGVPASTSSPADTITEGDEQARRRRRRRGGRGRGRSRREDEETPGAPASDEVGWQEFDDLSQIDGADSDREYTFEEADADTLAELGLPAQDVTASAEPAEEKPKRRSARTPKAEAAGDAAVEEKPKRRSTRAPKVDESADAAPDEKPKRRSTRTPKATAADEPATEEKPKRRSTRAPKAKAAPSGDGGEGAEGEPQGIWGRFRTARKPRSGSTS